MLETRPGLTITNDTASIEQTQLGLSSLCKFVLEEYKCGQWMHIFH